MTTEQLLEQLRGVLFNHTPVMKTSPPLQVPARHISTRDFPHEQSKSSAVGTHDNPLAARGQRSSLKDPAMTPDREWTETTREKRFFSQQDHGQARMKTSVRARCRIWLEARLSEGPVPLSEVKKEAQQLGYGPKCLRVARKQLGVKPTACLAVPADQHS